jgi:hypothetical protein
LKKRDKGALKNQEKIEDTGFQLEKKNGSLLAC